MTSKNNKLGRNDLCCCGSGKKFEKCCIDKKPSEKEIKEVVRIFKKQNEERRQLEQMGIVINYVKPVPYQGRKVWGLGSRIYYKRPPHETFHEFIIYILKITLGKKWFDDQKKLKDEEQHHVFRCFVQFQLWQIKHADSKNKVNDHTWGFKPDGWSKDLLALAFDIASLQHTNKLPDDLMERLRDYNEYQGVRYEITVAAIFARLGFDIEFISPERGGPKHCEFIATERKTGTKIGVEVKSRQRKGVLHHSGNKDEEAILKGDIGKLISRALQKSEVGKMAYAIFIDMNCPLSKKPQITERRWVDDVIRVTGEKGKPRAENPDLYSTIFFTNFSYHYQESEYADPGEVLSTIPLYSKHPVDMKIINMIQNALQHHGNVPMIDCDDQNEQ